VPQRPSPRLSGLQRRFTAGIDQAEIDDIEQQLKQRVVDCAALVRELSSSNAAQHDVALAKLQLVMLREMSADDATCRIVYTAPPTESLHLSNSALRTFICKTLTLQLPQMTGALPSDKCKATCDNGITTCGAAAGSCGMHSGQCRIGGGHKHRHNCFADAYHTMQVAAGNLAHREGTNISNGTKPVKECRRDGRPIPMAERKTRTITPDNTIRDGSSSVSYIDVTVVDPLAPSNVSKLSTTTQLTTTAIHHKMTQTYAQAWITAPVESVGIRTISSLGSICSNTRADIRKAAALSETRHKWAATAFVHFFTRKFVIDYTNAMAESTDSAAARFFGSTIVGNDRTGPINDEEKRIDVLRDDYTQSRRRGRIACN